MTPELKSGGARACFFIDSELVSIRIIPNVSVAVWLRDLHTRQPWIVEQGARIWPASRLLSERNTVGRSRNGQGSVEDSGFSASPASPAPASLTLSAHWAVELLLKLRFDTGCFDAASIRRRLVYLQTLLEAIPGYSQRSIAELLLLGDAERRQLIYGWNETQADFPRDTCVHSLFEAWARRTPDVLALTCAGRHLTYHELNRRANQLAHLLQARGVGPGALAGKRDRHAGHS